MLKSSTSLQTQLRLRRATERLRVEALGGEPTLESNPFDFYAHQRALERIAEQERELAAIEQETGALDFSFDGHDVYDHTMTFRRLKEVIDPIGRTLRWTARDQAVIDGDEMPGGTEVANLAEPVLSGIFESSFGIRVQGAPLAEQYSLLHEPLFHRTATRVMSVFRTARDSEAPAEVLATFAGLRSNSVYGFRALASALSAATSPTRIRWKNEEVIAVLPATATKIVAALDNMSVSEDEVSVVGILTGGDVTDERFHLVPENPQPGDPRHYRGNVEPGVLSTLHSIRFGARVEAKVTVILTESDYLARPKTEYVLKAMRVIGDAT